MKSCWNERKKKKKKKKAGIKKFIKINTKLLREKTPDFVSKNLSFVFGMLISIDEKQMKYSSGAYI